jgi:putative flippase GtrA
MGPRLRRWGLFNLVGLGGFVLQLATITILTRRYGWPTASATAVGLEVAFMHNLLAHTHWTWREYPLRNWRDWLIRWARYQLAKTTSLAANVGITAVLAGPVRLPVELANIAAVLLCALPNFFIAEWFVLPGDGQNVVPASIRRALHIH